MSSILSLFVTVLNASVSWFSSIFDASGLGSFFLAMIFIYFIANKLMPAISGAGSDSAKKRHDKENE